MQPRISHPLHAWLRHVHLLHWSRIYRHQNIYPPARYDDDAPIMQPVLSNLPPSVGGWPSKRKARRNRLTLCIVAGGTVPW